MKRLLRKLSARFYLSLGLVSLVMSLLLLAFFFEMVPDESRIVRESRAALAESIAAYSTALLGQGQTGQLEATLEFVVDRNPDLLSAGIRTVDGQLVAAIGEHDQHWQGAGNQGSTESHIHVPLYAGDAAWGQVELAFKPLHAAGLLGWLQDLRVQLSLFLAIAGFVVFYFYLGRMLKHLDPSRAVPERVRVLAAETTQGSGKPGTVLDDTDRAGQPGVR